MTGVPSSSRTKARSLTAAVLLIACSLAVLVIVRRVAQPVELEWMTGSILDHIERVYQGKPVYAAPSADWIPFLYPPGYYWVSALVAKFLPLFAAARMVSLVSTCVATLCAYLMARRLGLSQYWSLVAPATFVACFTRLSHWFDIERSDTLFVACIAVATLLTLEGKRVSMVIAGIVLAFACITKQQALFTVLAIFAAQVGMRKWGNLLAVMLPFASVFGAMCIHQQLQTGGWFSYYCWALPRSHGIEPELVTVFLVLDQAKFPLFTLSTVFAMRFAFQGLRAQLAGQCFTVVQEREWVLTLVLLSCWASSGLSRMHLGGFPNVLLPWALFASVALARLASMGEQLATQSEGLLWTLHGLFALSVLAGLEDPADALPPAGAQAAAVQFKTLIADLERHGDVLVTGRGHVTQTRHFHMAALLDVFRHGDSVPALSKDLQQHRFSAIILDNPVELYGHGVLKSPTRDRAILRDTLTHYCIYQRLPKAPLPVVGFKTQPAWLLLPRTSNLPALSESELLKRLEDETAIADSFGQLADPKLSAMRARSCEATLTFEAHGVGAPMPTQP